MLCPSNNHNDCLIKYVIPLFKHKVAMKKTKYDTVQSTKQEWSIYWEIEVLVIVSMMLLQETGHAITQ